jgi:hypothetical protein
VTDTNASAKRYDLKNCILWPKSPFDIRWLRKINKALIKEAKTNKMLNAAQRLLFLIDSAKKYIDDKKVPQSQSKIKTNKKSHPMNVPFSLLVDIKISVSYFEPKMRQRIGGVSLFLHFKKG